MSTKFERLEVSDWRQFRQVEMDFHPNLTVMTGANGAGKTTLLNILGRHFGWMVAFIATSRLTRKGVYKYFSGTSAEVDEEANPTRQVGSVKYTDGLEASIEVQVQVSESFDVVLQNQQQVQGVFLPSHRPVYTYQRLEQIPTQVDARDQIFEQYYSNLRAMYQPRARYESSSYRLKASLISLATFGYGNEVVEANPEALATFQGFERVLRQVLPPAIGFQRLAIRLPDLVLECTSGDFSLDAASGGVAAVVDIAWQLYMKSLVVSEFVAVCDEPENHLHPELQRSILPGLIRAFPSVQFIIATHNPFVVTSVQKSNIYVLDFVESRVESSYLEEVDRAGSANQVLRDALGVQVPIPLWVESRIDEIVHRFEQRALSDETLAQLRGEMAEVGLGHVFPDAVAKLVRESNGDSAQ